jgi:hypothetical protein
MGMLLSLRSTVLLALTQLLLDPKTAAEYAFIAFPIKNAEVVNKGEKPVTELGLPSVYEIFRSYWISI